jgi:hypothetical protein
LRAGFFAVVFLRAVVFRPDALAVTFLRAPDVRSAPPVRADDSAPIGVGAAGAGCAGCAAGQTDPGCCWSLGQPGPRFSSLIVCSPNNRKVESWAAMTVNVHPV